MAGLVHYTVDEHVARITLDSPHNRNALSAELVEGLHESFSHVAGESQVRAVVLAHTGSTFCAGADLSQAAGADELDAAVDRGRQLTALLRAILELPVPVVGAVDGHVRAGGLGLVGACDIVVAGPKSTFALTEARIGVAPGIISLTLLPKMTARAAGRYFLTGETFGAAEAAAVGLVTIAADDVDAGVATVTSELGKGSPQGLAASKALTTQPILAEVHRRADDLAAQSARLFLSPEAREGMLAFLQKRPPRWL